MYVTRLGGAKPGQANTDHCSTAAERHCFTSYTPLCKLQLRQNPLALHTQTHTHSKTVAWTPGQGPKRRDKHVHAATMVKCLIRITTRVNVHLRMINHCYRDVKVRVLSLGPRMLGKALGVLPLYPALAGQQESASVTPLPGTPLPCVQPSNPPGKLAEPARDVLYMEVPTAFSILNQSLPQQCWRGGSDTILLVVCAYWRS